MDKTNILVGYREQIKPLITFKEEEWALITPFLKVRKLKKNEFFVQSGKICKEMAFIVEGSMRFCNVIDGREVTGYFSFENSFVTALKSYLTGEPSIYDIKTLEETIIVTIFKADMEVLSNLPLTSFKMERFGRLVSERFNILFEDRIKSFVVKTPEERYLELLKSSKQIIRRIPVQYIAQYIGITPVSLSRIRRKILDSATTPNSFDS